MSFMALTLFVLVIIKSSILMQFFKDIVGIIILYSPTFDSIIRTINVGKQQISL